MPIELYFFLQQVFGCRQTHTHSCYDSVPTLDCPSSLLLSWQSAIHTPLKVMEATFQGAFHLKEYKKNHLPPNSTNSRVRKPEFNPFSDDHKLDYIGHPSTSLSLRLCLWKYDWATSVTFNFLIFSMGPHLEVKTYTELQYIKEIKRLNLDKEWVF